MRTVLAAAAAVVSALAVAASASATHVPTTGTQIRLLNPAATPTTFAANSPFYVRQGFVCLPTERAVCRDPRTGFRLYVDGVRMQSRLDLAFKVTCTDGVSTYDTCSSRLNMTTFPQGLAPGAHVLRGEWWSRGQLSIVREATIEFVG